jgi:hypothetical protein
MLITHFTKPNHVNNILLTNELKLEGSNFDEEFQKIYFKAQANIRFLWFTEKNYCYTAKPIITDNERNFIEFIPEFNLIGFQFDSEEIGAFKWEDWYKKRLIFKKKELIINSLNQTAKERGDDPQHYWIIEHNVSLEKCISVILWRSDGTYKSLELKELLSITNFNSI